ncbi:GNAT family N-acetyltransferase [Kitasatospora sp. NPDC058032]|uniref:GNAT family N-acetyltransferase n=1 Tax=Kitasatospora sp. NPDC058032 TaxID=3346307 RepID=UPI0036DE7930
MDITLREVRDGDLPALFAQTSDPEGIRLAAFTAEDPSDRAWFDAHGERLRRDPAVLVRTVVGVDGEVLGHVGVFGPSEEREVTRGFFVVTRREHGFANARGEEIDEVVLTLSG